MQYPGELIGHRKDGRPIYLQAGGSTEIPEVQPPDPVAAVPPSGPWFTQADIEDARKQEKDKLYSRLNTQGSKLNALEEQLKTWQTERDAADQARQTAEQETAEAQRRQAEEELSVRELLAKREQEWTARLEQVHKDTAAQMALLQKDRELAQLQAFIQRRVMEESEHIAPQLVDLVTGNTPEEVEASIATMRTKTAEIMTGLQEASTVLASNMRGVSTNGFVADGPLDNQTATHQISAEELGSMPLSQYAKHRQQLLGGAANGNGGLFG